MENLTDDSTQYGFKLLPLTYKNSSFCIGSSQSNCFFLRSSKNSPLLLKTSKNKKKRVHNWVNTIQTSDRGWSAKFASNLLNVQCQVCGKNGLFYHFQSGLVFFNRKAAENLVSLYKDKKRGMLTTKYVHVNNLLHSLLKFWIALSCFLVTVGFFFLCSLLQILCKPYCSIFEYWPKVPGTVL